MKLFERAWATRASQPTGVRTQLGPSTAVMKQHVMPDPISRVYTSIKVTTMNNRMMVDVSVIDIRCNGNTSSAKSMAAKKNLGQGITIHEVGINNDEQLSIASLWLNAGLQSAKQAGRMMQGAVTLVVSNRQ